MQRAEGEVVMRQWLHDNGPALFLVLGCAAAGFTIAQGLMRI